ncbi:hypothetical protein PGB90_004145 [Kerria lacca]
MSYCRKDGKDTIIFVTKEDHDVPSSIQLPEPERPAGIILPDGSINWNCPCLGGMATGPCGIEFREAFSCFHYSKADPKGSDCLDSFSSMQECMKKYPTLYASHSKDLEDGKYLDEEDEELEKEENNFHKDVLKNQQQK